MRGKNRAGKGVARLLDLALKDNSAASAVTLLQEVLESLPQGVVMFSAEGKVLFCNHRYSEIYNLPRERLQPGLTLRELFVLRAGDENLGPREERMCASLIEAARKGKVVSGYLDTQDGRTIRCINTPLPSGAWVITHEDVTQQRAAERQIEHLANHDPLTDLPNRVSFRTRLQEALLENPRDKLLAVMFLDLDNFKGVNDTLGHQAGDELLKEVAERLRACMRSTDMVARFGGDEFVIVSSALHGPSEAATLAKRMREAILQPFDLLNHQLVIDSSVGIALSPSDGTDAEQLLKNADLALYSAKGSGRGTYRFFENEMDVRMSERRALELDLRAAFVNREFEILYQPLVNLEHNRVSGCEALLRWNHPRRGSVSPCVFVPVAEEIGLIPRIGEWVIRTACAEAAKWPDDVHVAVNVSPVQFRSQNLVQIVTHALTSSGILAKRLEIEITETVLLERTDETLEILNQLRGLGVRIALDDFGTGYSSLSYLQKFPFDKIKIDQAFISGLSEESESSAIVRAVTGIAGSLNMVTTAEGVETEHQRAVVTALGCTEMQGNLFSVPLAAEEIARLLKANVRSKRDRAA